ncbi:site-specific DNA-methyltransferase [Acidovorax sp. sif1233]|uniref:DNA-methyltransferase n=1 Tax=Acidovorax sp. sif1233 TaxID=2854792 RepID=UPI001C454047|nr:site-specific DNA-methyltransferase [Acidovorax sp. sif1233]MBV7457363.1 site-specific DNA-methyltransferase [Acidovorax sp. sif1233]
MHDSKHHPWLNHCHFGDVRAVLRQMIADGVKVQTIVTSPPYWGLRSYLPAEHADKALEIGAEPTLAEFLANMVEVFGLAREVLADDGTLWLNMGDSYANDGKWGGSSGGKHVKALHGDSGIGRQKVTSGLKPKDLCGQPWRLAFALQDAGWWLRQDIVWHKPNPMPESIKDRCTKAHEYLFLLAKSESYYFDQGAISEELEASSIARLAQAGCEEQAGSNRVPGKTNGAMKAVGGSRRNSFARETKYSDGEHGQKPQARANREDIDYSGRRNKRSVWTVSTRGYKGAHFATFPPALIEPCILAGAPAGGIVLDPFFGSGTTGQVAQQLGRQFIGIDINTANEPLQLERLRQPGLVL